MQGSGTVAEPLGRDGDRRVPGRGINRPGSYLRGDDRHEMRRLRRAAAVQVEIVAVYEEDGGLRGKLVREDSPGIGEADPGLPELPAQTASDRAS